MPPCQKTHQTVPSLQHNVPFLLYERFRYNHIILSCSAISWITFGFYVPQMIKNKSKYIVNILYILYAFFFDQLVPCSLYNRLRIFIEILNLEYFDTLNSKILKEDIANTNNIVDFGLALRSGLYVRRSYSS